MIAVIGSSNVDMVINVDDFTLPGQTQKGLELSYYPGGKGANQAVTSRLLGGEVYFLTCLGNDGNAQMMKRELEAIDLGNGIRYVDSPNGVALIEVSSSGENRIIIYPGANSHLSPEIIADSRESLLKADILLLQNEIPFESTLYAAKLFSEAGKTVIFDPAPSSNIDKSILRYVSIITPNETEMAELAGYNLGIEEATAKLHKMGCEDVLLKRGNKGVFFSGRSKSLVVPAFKVRAIDSTAAGDVFNGAFACSLDRGLDLHASLRYACAAAALSVTRRGAQKSIPRNEEIGSLLGE
jgi:ribokinase